MPARKHPKAIVPSAPRNGVFFSTLLELLDDAQETGRSLKLSRSVPPPTGPTRPGSDAAIQNYPIPGDPVAMAAQLEIDPTQTHHDGVWFPRAEIVPFADFNNRYPAGSCYVIGRGPTTFDYRQLAEITDPIFFINDAICLEKFARSDTFFFAHDAAMRVWLDGSMRSTAVLPTNGTILADEPAAMLAHNGRVVLYHRQDEDRESLMRMTRDELAIEEALFGHSGTIHSLLHFVWYCGVRKITYIGCDAINRRDLLATQCASHDGYDPRLQNKSSTAPGWHYLQIRRVQELLTVLFGIQTCHVGTPDLGR